MQTKLLYVETIANKTKVTALTRSLTAVLVSIDHHHSVLFLEVEEKKYFNLSSARCHGHMQDLQIVSYTHVGAAFSDFRCVLPVVSIV